VQGGMRAMEVIVMKVVRKEGSAVVTGVVGPGIGPLAGDGLDEAFFPCRWFEGDRVW